jgi:HK97 family phage portal protein
LAIRDTLARLFGAKASIIGLGADEIPDRPLEKGWDDAAILSTYADDTWPYVCARILAENGAMPPLRFGTLDAKGQFTPVDPSHPVQDLFDHPNPQMTGSDFRHLLITYLEMVGHAPIEIVRPLAGRRMLTRNRNGTELWPVNPSWWRIVANPDGTIRGYLWVKRSQEDVAWKPEQMTYLRWPNPLDRWYGLGRIAAVRQAVMAEEYAAVRDKKLEKNLGVPPGILSSEMPLGDPTAELLQKRWSQAVGGYQNAGKIAILGSKTTYQAIVQNARDAQWLETRKGRVHEITAAFGVPMVLVLGMKDATFANASEAVDFLWQETLQPRLDRIAEAITFRLLPLLTDEKLVAQFDYGHIAALNENQSEVVTRAKAMADTGAVTVDEARAVMGMEPHADKTVGLMQLVPSTMALTSTADIVAPPEPPAPPAGVTPPGPAEPPKARKSIESRETVLAPIRDAYVRDLGSFFGAQRNAVLNAFGKATPEEEAFLDRLIEIIGSKRFRDRLRRISQAPIEAAVTLGATEAARALSIEVSFAIPTSDAALARVTNHLDLLGKGIENTTIADVQRVVTSQLQAGATHEAMRTALGELFDGYEDWRLDRIARTETAAAYNLGGLGQYRSAGVMLVTVVDGDADEICAGWNGREHVPLDEAEGSPLGHPNCTRSWIPEVGDGFGKSAPQAAAAVPPEGGTARTFKSQTARPVVGPPARRAQPESSTDGTAYQRFREIDTLMREPYGVDVGSPEPER